jgi:hypothetical protein
VAAKVVPGIQLSSPDQLEEAFSYPEVDPYPPSIHDLRRHLLQTIPYHWLVDPCDCDDPVVTLLSYRQSWLCTMCLLPHH